MIDFSDVRESIQDHHDEQMLKNARQLASRDNGRSIFYNLQILVKKHEHLRCQEGINLIAAEAPSSSAVRTLLGGDLGARASGGAIGRTNRFFTGLDVADEIESLCIGMLTKMFNCSRADPRLLSGLHATTVVYAALKSRLNAKSVMSLTFSNGGDTSSRHEGPAGILEYDIYDIPVEEDGLSIDLAKFEEYAEAVKPDVVSLGTGLNLFPFPVREIKDIISSWGGLLYFDAAHQAGLIAGGQYPNPLDKGADILTASSGKTFSGPQGGFICWNREDLTDSIYTTIFPVLTGTHQLNRVAALTAACCELDEFGADYMQCVVENAQALGAALHRAGLDVLGSERGYTTTHQIAIRMPPGRQGHEGAQLLSRCGINANKVTLPGDEGNMASGIRFGVVEVTRLGMRVREMEELADIIASAFDRQPDESCLAKKAIDIRRRFGSLSYTFEEG